jgi:GT2 family glycosyltransferase
MTPSSRLAIILINWNSAGDTLRALDMISGWERLNPGVIVVDNGSRDDDLAMLREAGNDFRLVLNNSNRGYAGGNNEGISLALREGYHFIMLLNSDAVVEEECVARLLACLAGTPGLGVAGPLLEEHGRISAGGRNIGIYSDTRIPVEKADTTPFLRPVDYVPGTLLIARREAFETTGLLDEDYFFSGEVADFCTRVRAGGLGCAVYSGCVATHTPDTGSAVRDTLYNYYTLRNRFLFVKRNFRFSRGFFFLRWVAGGIVRIALATAAGKKDRARAFRLGLRDGATGRFGDRNDLFHG